MWPVARPGGRQNLSGGKKRPDRRGPAPAASRDSGSHRLDEDLWDDATDLACEESARANNTDTCKHSARLMQRSVTIYKDLGGRYRGPRDPNNSLVRWGQQRWRTRDGSPSRGVTRYLPSAAWDELTEEEKDEADATKRRGHARGEQWVANPPPARRASRRARRAP